MIVDTGVLYSLADRRDPHHERVRSLLSGREYRLVPEPVAVETALLMERRLGHEAEASFLRSLEGKVFAVECPTAEDRRRAAELVIQYRDARLGYVDASIVAMAERRGERRIATTDRRHFRIVRPRTIEAFELLPSDP